MPPPPSAFAEADGFGPASIGAATATPHKLPSLRLARIAGPAFLVAIGYVDPGNWATDIAAGSGYGSALLPVVLFAGLAAILLQHLAAKLGIVTGLDLAEASAVRYGPVVRVFLWLAAEAAIIACDLAEVVGTAIAFQLLFGLPLIWGVCLAAGDTLLLLGLQRRGMKPLGALMMAVIIMVALSFCVELVLAAPSPSTMLAQSAGVTRILSDQGMLTIAIGIIGATVMPHNLYLHSALVKQRRSGASTDARLRDARRDNLRALGLAALVNAAIVVLAAAVFHRAGLTHVTDIADAYHLLGPLLGSAAGTLFALALLASSQSSTLTGTLAGQIVLEGFTRLRVAPWQRRLFSRLLAVVPAVIVVGAAGPHATTSLLVLSQVALSLQLPFAMLPLLAITGDPRRMGRFANGPVLKTASWSLAVLIVGLDMMLVRQSL
jgi:manganese transport protein